MCVWPSCEHCAKNSVLARARSKLGCPIKTKSDEFSILSSGRFTFDLRVKEAYLISCMKSELDTKYEKIKSNIDVEHQQRH